MSWTKVCFLHPYSRRWLEVWFKKVSKALKAIKLLTYKPFRILFAAEDIDVKIETFNDRGEKVLQGSAEVAQPTTVYAFTGQGSQEPDMGMDLHDSSPAARAIREGTDAHLLAVYRFLIIENPKEKTIHFGSVKGHAIRQCYMDMTYNASYLEQG